MASAIFLSSPKYLFQKRETPFLTEAATIENRTILGKGSSTLSGNYVIEESASRDKNGDEHTYRRLIFEQVISDTGVQSVHRSLAVFGNQI